jgi:UDP-glucose 4-epimerase
MGSGLGKKKETRPSKQILVQEAPMSKTILVTGGAGYIGSHTVLVLATAGYKCVIVDSLVNASEESLGRVKALLPEGAPAPEFVKLELCDAAAVEAFFQKNSEFAACIHFAGLKAVGESVAKPLYYYENNIAGTVNLLKALDSINCRNIVFSSSATVYGDPMTKNKDPAAITEEYPLQATNPYGRTKLFIEEILRDVAISAPGKWKIVLLRYFNPIGAHPSGTIGEDPSGIPNNLCPYILQVAVGRRDELGVFGDDYDTPDGTGVRDYIHVMDLAEGHLAAVQKGIFQGQMSEDCEAFNLGSGTGTSVLQMVKHLEKASGKEIKYKIAPRRPGDCATVCANVDKVNKVWGWKVQKTMEEACEDMWKWQSSNPTGYSAK